MTRSITPTLNPDNLIAAVMELSGGDVATARRILADSFIRLIREHGVSESDLVVIASVLEIPLTELKRRVVA